MRQKVLCVRGALKGEDSMWLADLAPLFAIIGITVVLALILLGPSLFSSYKNWRIKRG